MSSIAATLLSLALLGNAGGEARALEGCYVLARHSVDAGLEDGEWPGASVLDEEVARCLEAGGAIDDRRVAADAAAGLDDAEEGGGEQAPDLEEEDEGWEEDEGGAGAEPEDGDEEPWAGADASPPPRP